MKSVMSHSFSRTPSANIQRSRFNRNHGFKTTFDAGWLIPVLVDEVLPGDTVSCKMTTFARLATPIVPIMDNLKCDSFFFFVPNRLIWNNWEKMNGQQTDPGDSTDYLVPIMTSPNIGSPAGFQVGGLSDYFGIPTQIPNLPVVSLWHRAYNLIYNEWFRDQNLQDSVTVDKGDGPDTPANYTLLRRGKRHDYFTSCLPWPQKGPAVPLPLGTQAPIRGWGQAVGDSGINDRIYVKSASGTYQGVLVNDVQGASNYTTANNPLWNTGDPNVMMWQQDGDFAEGANTGYNYADLSEATASTINALREAFQLQRLYERDARGGTRYTEIIRSHFGVVSPDARLQRPEYLGGGSTPVSFHPVAQTSQTDSETPQGNLAAFATMSGHGQGFTKSFTEHGVLLGLISVRADLNYQQGLPRMFSRRTRWDFYWPALAHIGEQAVLNKEIYAVDPVATPSQNDAVFGYQERYAEYRYKPSIITGRFRSTYAQSLDIWHLAQEFGALPVLNNEFIMDDPPVDRVIATPDEPQFLLDTYFNYNWVRPMPTYSVPGLIDHF